jgi:phosphotransferase system enzyme I (PtsP)
MVYAVPPLDIGGDKVLSYFDYHLKEKNPYLGMRSIRFSLKHTDIFMQQIRAILRAAAGKDVRIMFPMIFSLDEFREAKSIVLKCVKGLKKEGISCQHKPKLGIMIELPAVLEIIDDLAHESDFFSIGTNDFIQYMLAVDRTNEKVAELYVPHHPAVLRGLKKVVDAAVKHKIDVSVCGDMSHDIKYLPYLLGMGVRKISVDANYIPQIQNAVGKIQIKDAQKHTKLILSKSRLSDVSRLFK